MLELGLEKLSSCLQDEKGTRRDFPKIGNIIAKGVQYTCESCPHGTPSGFTWLENRV